MQTGIWIISDGRPKAGKEHRVPLPEAALRILLSRKAEQEPATDTLALPGRKDGKLLSDMSLTDVLKCIKRADQTAHGFRSSFHDWGAQATNYPHDMAEMALTHTEGDKVEAVYRHGDMFRKRRRMMADWSTHCDTIRKEGKVIHLYEARSLGAA